MHCGDLMADGGAAYITMATSLRRQFVTIRWRVVPIWQTSIPQVLCTFEPINLAYSCLFKVLQINLLSIPIDWICLLVNYILKGVLIGISILFISTIVQHHHS